MECYTNNCNLFAVVCVSPEANEISFPQINCRAKQLNGTTTTQVRLERCSAECVCVCVDSRQTISTKWINLMRSITQTSGIRNRTGWRWNQRCLISIHRTRAYEAWSVSLYSNDTSTQCTLRHHRRRRRLISTTATTCVSVAVRNDAHDAIEFKARFSSRSKNHVASGRHRSNFISIAIPVGGPEIGRRRLDFPKYKFAIAICIRIITVEAVAIHEDPAEIIKLYRVPFMCTYNSCISVRTARNDNI